MQHNTPIPTKHTKVPAYLKAIGATEVMTSAGKRGDLAAFEAIIRDVCGRFSRPDLCQVAARHLSKTYDHAFSRGFAGRVHA